MSRIRSDDYVVIANWFARLCTAAICAAVVVLCTRMPRTTKAALSKKRAVKVASNIANAEGVLRLQAVREFPGDHWSQGDAYSFREFRRVTTVAAKESVAIGSVLQALDEYLRNNPKKRNQNKVPLCKPRSFYD